MSLPPGAERFYSGEKSDMASPLVFIEANVGDSGRNTRRPIVIVKAELTLFHATKANPDARAALYIYREDDPDPVELDVLLANGTLAQVKRCYSHAPSSRMSNRGVGGDALNVGTTRDLSYQIEIVGTDAGDCTARATIWFLP